MNILKEVLLNQLIRISLVHRLAKRRHITGLNADGEGVNQVYDLYFGDVDVEGKQILEIGPGHTYEIMEKALNNGAARVTIIDIEKYIADEDVRKNGINYVIYGGNRMPFERDTFDIVCSHTVFEHLRNPSVTVSEVYRVLKAGGIGIHLIDLQDHFFIGGDNPNIFNCLRYSDAVWNAMTYNRSTYVNRLRYSDWIQLFESTGFKVEKADRSVSTCIKELYDGNNIPYLGHLAEVDATTSWVTIFSRKPKLEYGCES
jgi:SAM-dependent methyltransferase